MSNLWEESSSGNKRVARTKKAIISALFELMKEKELERITITELSVRAGVDRKTFYHYYKSVQDVIEECEDIVIGSVITLMRRVRAAEPDHRTEFFDVFNRYLIENLDFVSKLVQTGAMTLFAQKAGDAFKSEVFLILQQDLQDWSDHDRTILELGILDMAIGLMSLYLNWFRDNRDLTLEEVGRLAKNMAIGSLSALTHTLGKDLQGITDYIF